MQKGSRLRQNDFRVVFTLVLVFTVFTAILEFMMRVYRDDQMHLWQSVHSDNRIRG